MPANAKISINMINTGEGMDTKAFDWYPCSVEATAVQLAAAAVFLVAIVGRCMPYVLKVIPSPGTPCALTGHRLRHVALRTGTHPCHSGVIFTCQFLRVPGVA